MITSLRVRNYKCLRDVTIPLSPLTVLVGKNDTGKSSVLKAIHALGGLTRNERVATALSAPISELAWRGTTDPLSWTVSVASDQRTLLRGASCTYEVALTSDRHDVKVAEERVRDDGGLIADRRSNETGSTVLFADTGKSNQTRPEASLLWEIVNHRSDRPGATADAIGALFRGIHYFRLDPSRLAAPSLLHPSAPSIEERGDGLAAVLDYLLSTNRREFQRLEEELRVIVPMVQEVQVPTVKVDGSSNGKEVVLRLQDGTKIRARHVSEGVLLVLAFLTLVHQEDAASVLLLEEPETAIHPRQLQRVMSHLRSLTDPKRPGGPVQVICTTHSPYLLDFVKPEEVVCLGRKATGETVAAALSTIEGVKTRMSLGSTLGEIWFNVGEDELLKELLA